MTRRRPGARMTEAREQAAEGLENQNRIPASEILRTCLAKTKETFPDGL